MRTQCEVLMADVFGSITDEALNRIVGSPSAGPFFFNYVAPSLWTVPRLGLPVTTYRLGLRECSQIYGLSAFPVPGIRSHSHIASRFSMQISTFLRAIRSLFRRASAPSQGPNVRAQVQCQFAVACIPDDVTKLVATDALQSQPG